MTLRRPAAHLRRAPGWRRSGDESCWEGLVAEGGDFASASRPTRTPRPHSAIEGGQLDSWLEHLQRMQSSLLRSPDHDQVLAFNNRTASIPALHKEPTGHPWKQQGIPTFSGGSSSCGSPGLYQSSLGSQESLKTGIFCPRERRGSWERAHIKQVPKTEKTQLSYLAPVKIGWLPIQRKVTVACKQSQFLDHCVGQVIPNKVFTILYIQICVYVLKVGSPANLYVVSDFFTLSLEHWIIFFSEITCTDFAEQF